MSMKDILREQMKQSQTSVVGQLDNYLFKQINKPNDRAINVNAPSQAGGCMRANYYMRKQYDKDNTTTPRTMRIFNNGDHVHIRLQQYLLDMYLLIMDEVPLINDKYNIQGHTDGFLDFGDEVAILEIKSINDHQFSQLVDAKPEHKRQGLVYLFCAEERRKYLRSQYKNRKEFRGSESERAEYFRQHYQHMKDGSRYTREQKIEKEVELNLISDDVLFGYEKPVNKVIFLYENKNDQNLKEFTVELNAKTKHILEGILEDYTTLNELCDSNIVPPRIKGATKSGSCRWCDYVNTCWVV